MLIVPCPAARRLPIGKILQFDYNFFRWPHTTARKNLKRFGRDGETMAIPGSKRGREADIGVADGFLTAFKSAIKKTIFCTFLRYPEGNFEQCWLRPVFFFFLNKLFANICTNIFSRYGY